MGISQDLFLSPNIHSLHSTVTMFLFPRLPLLLSIAIIELSHLPPTNSCNKFQPPASLTNEPCNRYTSYCSRGVVPEGWRVTCRSGGVAGCTSTCRGGRATVTCTPQDEPCEFYERLAMTTCSNPRATFRLTANCLRGVRRCQAIINCVPAPGTADINVWLRPVPTAPGTPVPC